MPSFNYHTELYRDISNHLTNSGIKGSCASHWQHLKERKEHFRRLITNYSELLIFQFVNNGIRLGANENL